MTSTCGLPVVLPSGKWGYTARMPRSRPPLTPGEHVAHRRKERRLSIAEAARRASVEWRTWKKWEDGSRRPDDRNYLAIDEAIEWEPGSAEAVYGGGAPTPRDLATVTELHPGVAHAPPNDEAILVGELTDMGLSPAAIAVQLEGYRAAKTQLRMVFRDIGRQQAAGQ